MAKWSGCKFWYVSNKDTDDISETKKEQVMKKLEMGKIRDGQMKKSKEGRLWKKKNRRNMTEIKQKENKKR